MGKNKKGKKEDIDLKSLEKEVSDLKNIAARAQADLVNYRNRMKIELLDIEKKTIKNFSLKILSDMCLSFLFLADSTSHLIASAWALLLLTSTGT